MRICHYDFSKPFDIKDGVGVLIVENASKFVQYCNDFILQQVGEDCDFIIDDGDKPFSFKKSGCIVFDFSIYLSMTKNSCRHLRFNRCRCR